MVRGVRHGVVGLVVVLIAAIGPVTLSAGATRSTPGRAVGSQAFLRTTPPGGPQARGGSIKVLQFGSSGQWTSLDPGTQTYIGAAAPLFAAVFGGLFEQTSTGTVVPVMAASYDESADAKTFTIHLHPGMTFSDGTPFNSAAVKWNFERDLGSSSTCVCVVNFPIQSIDTPDDATVVLNLTRPFPAMIDAFAGEAPDFIASPTAYQRLGASTFQLKPVGAGPFEVVTDQSNYKLALKRNPRYWQPGHPYLNNLTFLTVGNEISAYGGLVNHEGDVLTGYSDFTQVAAASKLANVYQIAGVTPITIQFNTMIPPFNNLKAREAILYATNLQAINKGLFKGLAVMTQSPTGPGGLFFEPTVPGTLTFNLAKARQLVHQLGGLSVILPANTPGKIQVNPVLQNLTFNIAEALQEQWGKAGIKTSLFSSKTGTPATIGSCGSYDPATGVGLGFCFGDTAATSNIHDPQLIQMIANAATISDQTARAQAYQAIFVYINQNAYAVFLGLPPAYLLTTRQVRWPVNEPGLLAPPSTEYWENVSVKS